MTSKVSLTGWGIYFVTYVGQGHLTNQGIPIVSAEDDLKKRRQPGGSMDQRDAGATYSGFSATRFGG
ncbi:MAG: hypothetical protein A3F68_02410 [Acidobacteria bacterium RIFCSPLOWO2_12_FULL_54_10]|nr:MAG: hypothetical protein A3F68_02410 [Acidobacteria bacterium RIFCSPLOWO2_12_FULL_54_10]